MADLMNSVGGLTGKEVKAVTVQVSNGLQRLHSSGILHADIKPANLLLSSAGIVKIIDFELSFELDSTSYSTRWARQAGTAPYMAPEMFPDDIFDYAMAYNSDKGKEYILDEGKSITFGFGIDIWALGISMLELLYGANVMLGQIMRGTFIDADFIYRSKILLQTGELSTDPKQNMARFADHYHQQRFGINLAYKEPRRISRGLKRDKQLVDLLFRRCLDINPETRATAQQICSLPFVVDILGSRFNKDNDLCHPDTSLSLAASKSATTLRKLINRAQNPSSCSPV
eukprot:CAMPEP_0204842368 /NCGR_PEP_ID=MMETSP1346-20131115/45990_1 /ASSEMBLY_ACC=CAM_ASM_000771 /TAXON_ID=215587 /ORGANISM="Aplanochytrium stocchinoi, Strain GSBS06" /LENGTH=285 /DNA_ID=CAMNT_0051981111 /DNA_START=105 /DNA_END=962 /DNA_ORIENTATION=+